MALIYCPDCGEAIGEYYSILDVDRYIEKAKKEHAGKCGADNAEKGVK